MRAFIIRPFGAKNGVDFDKVEEDLISPALDAVGIGGRTTGEVLEQGNIRADMFHLLLTSDLVVADVSIHNANVFYELGVRHSFRDRHTFLIKSSGDDVPFDIKTDRYFRYDRDDPGSNLEGLTAALRATLDSEKADSPLFQLLPGLKAQDRAHFVEVPPDFRDETDRAQVDGHRADLALFAQEAERFGLEWAEAGLRYVGEAQFAVRDMRNARLTWEKVRGYRSDDPQANQRLATIYQKLGDLTLSDQAIERALAAGGSDSDRAEMFSLRGSNAKARWIEDWSAASPDNRREAALSSSHLGPSSKAYEEAFDQDLNHFYSGLNALAMAAVQGDLAAALPDVWADRFDSDEEAERGASEARQRVANLAASVERSLEARGKRVERTGERDPWLEVSRADFACVTSDRPGRVGQRYKEATAGIPPFQLESVGRQLEMLVQLGVKTDNAKAGLEELQRSRAQGAGNNEPDEPIARVVVFTGHLIDAPDRPTPRFPASAEEKAREMIRRAVSDVVANTAGRTIGCAGGANGSDILFHEVCAEIGVETTLLLAGPRDAFVQASVQDGGPDWVRRFDELTESVNGRIRQLGAEMELPRWLRSFPDYSIWQRNNLWELLNGLVHGAEKTTLIALWDGKAGDGPGGTQDMVDIARQSGAHTVVLDANELLGK